MVWGAISRKKVYPLVHVEGNLSGLGYKKILQNFIPGAKTSKFAKFQKMTFQHDNAPVHKALVVHKWLQKRGVNPLPWPAQSPDLNPIENVWKYLSNRVYKVQIPSKEALLARVRSEWDKIPQEYLRSLYDSMPRRLEAVKKAKGWPTKY